MLQKLNSVHAKNKAFLQPKNIHDSRFGIAHFAGDVYYQVEGRCGSSLYPFPPIWIRFQKGHRKEAGVVRSFCRANNGKEGIK